MMFIFSILSLSFCSINSFHLSPVIGRGIPTCVYNVCKDNYLHSKLAPSSLFSNNGADLIKEQIKEMREEASVRLGKLHEKIHKEEASVVAESTCKFEFPDKVVSDEQLIENFSHKYSSPTKEAMKVREPEILLEETSWKVTLNIGRETGTWMPEHWGASGERILLNLVVKFSASPLETREEFLGSTLVAKKLDVLNNELNVAPTLTEGSRKISVKDGGWRILMGEGPAGTNLLRFFIEVEEQAENRGSDVYCPKGRIYCTCGYFPVVGRSSGVKEAIRHEQEQVSRRYKLLKKEEEEDTSIFSLKKISRSKQIFDVLSENQKLAERMREARIQEPQKDFLRFMDNGTTALSREGGVSCKVVKGLTTEYHILGRFSIASCGKGQLSLNETEDRKLSP